jgi:G:T-mismatch repair DNA endonuclease (very short patch repair protein)
MNEFILNALASVELAEELVLLLCERTLDPSKPEIDPVLDVDILCLLKNFVSCCLWHKHLCRFFMSNTDTKLHILKTYWSFNRL